VDHPDPAEAWRRHLGVTVDANGQIQLHGAP
jgi:hypothetical protein